MHILLSLIAVIVLGLIPWIGTTVIKGQLFFGVIIPYAAVAVFIVGVIWRVVKWAKSPVPFRIPTTAGQQKSLSWIKPNRIDNPSNGLEAVIRMALEVLAFRSLFRNTTASYSEAGPRLSYGGFPWLWLFAIAFHYAFLTTVLRHLRFFMDPVPFPLVALEYMDGLMEVLLPGLMLSGAVLLGAVTVLAIRRFLVPQVRYISLMADYFPLFLVFCIALSGICMRYIWKVDVVSVKELAMSLAAFKPAIPEGGITGFSYIFYIHLFYVSVLVAYLPFSKLMHAGGVFLSPTRNLPNNNRIVRHINPWNAPVKVHTYQEYEDDFREQMIEAGLPVEKEA